MFSEYLKRKESEKFNDDLIAATNGYGELIQIGTEEGKQIFKFTLNPDAKRCVCFVAGLHGNEKGGPYGALEFLKSQLYVPKTRKVIIIPLANPVGFNKNTRENGDDKDINRHFLDDALSDECKCIWNALKDENIDLLHTLHEDPGLKSYYCYYTHHKELAEDLKTLAKKYFDIYNKSHRPPEEDDENKLYGDEIIDGLIPLPHGITGTLEDKFLLHRGVPYITTESPGKMPLRKRIEFNKNAIKMTIQSF